MESGTPLSEQLEIFDITFALPAQSFAVTCWITTEESLPVVTEFALRLTHVCGTLSVAQLQLFFGFTDKEVAAVVRTLEDERLVMWEDDKIVLTPYALSRFLDSSDSVPRFFKISEWTGEVIFDLISFRHSKKPNRHRHANAMVELVPKNRDKQAKTIYWAGRSFQESFRDIMRKDKVEIYKVSEVEGGEHFMIQLPCSFSLALDERIGIARSLREELFADQLEIAESISDALSMGPHQNNEALFEFIEFFEDALLDRYAENRSFDLRKYVEDVHLKGSKRYDDFTEPILGSLYLSKNRRKLADYARKYAMPKDVNGTKCFCSEYWLAPQSDFWARSLNVWRLVEEQSKILRGEVSEQLDPEGRERRSQVGLKTLLQCDNSWSAKRLARIHGRAFPRLYRTTGRAMNGQCELFVVPGQFVCATFHYYIDSSIPVPIGFISTRPELVEIGVSLLHGIATTPNEVFSLQREGDSKDEGPIDFFKDDMPITESQEDLSQDADA